MGKKSTSDNTKAAREQGEIDERLAAEKTLADRPNQVNRFGAIDWTKNDDGSWLQEQTYSDDVNSLIDQQMSNMGSRGMMQGLVIDRARDNMMYAPDWGQFGDVQELQYNPSHLRNRAEKAAYERSTRRLDPRFAKEMESTELRLRNQGLRPGDRAYDAQMENFNNMRNDAYEAARLNATSEGRTEAAGDWQRQLDSTNYANALRSQRIKEYDAQRKYGLNELDAITAAGGGKDVLGFIGGAA